MIVGKLNRTDHAYFAMEKESSSSLKMFVDDRKKYYRKYILGEDIDETDEENQAVLIGNLVDCLLLIPEEFDTRFFRSTGEDKPTGQMLDFVNELYKELMNSLDENGVVTREFDEMCQAAYNTVGFKRDSLEKVKQRFITEGKAYFDEIVEVRPKKLQVITAQDYTNALNIIEGLRTNEFTKEIILQAETNEVEVHNQLVIEFEFEGVDFKVMLDKVIVEHDVKIVNGFDLKVTWNVDDFYNGYYLYRKAYIQGTLYSLALHKWMNEMGWTDYELAPFKFIVADSINYNAPLIYVMTEKALLDGLEGFQLKDRKYKGVKQIVSDLKWHKESGIWNISAENYKNKGIVEI